MTQEENFFFSYAYKNWTFSQKNSLQELNFVKLWHKELNSFLFDVTQRFDFFETLTMEPFFKNMTLRIELFFLNSENGTLLQIWLTPRIQPFWTFSFDSKNLIYSFQCRSKKWTFSPTDSKNWTLLNYHSKNWIFFFMTQRIEPFFLRDSMNWIFFRRIVPLLLNETRRIESSLKNVKNWPFFTYMTENSTFLWIFFTWLEELNIFWYDSKNWTFLNVTQRSEIFYRKCPRMDFLECDSKNWNFLNMTQRFEIDSKHWTSFSIWLKELNLLLANDSKTWTLFFKCLKELNLSWKRKRWLEELICSKISIKL